MSIANKIAKAGHNNDVDVRTRNIGNPPKKGVRRLNRHWAKKGSRGEKTLAFRDAKD